MAEELECNWSKIVYEYPTPGESVKRKRAWGDFSTGGSRGIRTSHEYVRKGGAAARMMLVQAAADQWGVPASSARSANSVITHKASNRKTTYGKVAEAAARLEAPKDVPLKDPKEWKVIGKPREAAGYRDKVTGKQVYGVDLKLPGMLNAAIKECPVFGGKVKSFDAAGVADARGVKKVVQVGDTAVAVVADTWWNAKTALDAAADRPGTRARTRRSPGEHRQHAQGGLDAEQAFVGNQTGDAKQGDRRRGEEGRGGLRLPVPEPRLHGADERDGALHGGQVRGVGARRRTARRRWPRPPSAPACRPTSARCYKMQPRRRLRPARRVPGLRDAGGAIAKEMPGTPVKLLWSREEDMAQGRYHPIMQCKLIGGLDAGDNLTGLHMRLSGQSILAAVRPAIVEQQKGRDPFTFQGVADAGEHSLGYTMPNLLIDHAMRNTHVPPGFWRGVNINQNAVFIECFMDELAEAAGQDPLEFRRKLMGPHPRKSLAVMNAVAEADRLDQAGARRRAPRHCADEAPSNSFVAAACELSVKDGNKVKIHRIVAATDCGYAVNPAQIERQVSGSFVYGLSALFMQECTVKDGAIEQTNFDAYQSMRIAQMPKVETIIVQGGGDVLGRHWRADHLRGGAGGAERHLQGDGQAHTARSR